MGVLNASGMGVIQFLLPLLQFKTREITLSELYALSPTGTQGDTANFNHYMAFLLIVPYKTVKGERVFGLVAMWPHLLQACHPSLGEAAHKLRLLTRRALLGETNHPAQLG